MKIGVISDTHIPSAAGELPEKLLSGLKGVDMIIHAGDIGDLNVIAKLKTICKNIKAVYGNMDPLEIKKKLPAKEVFEIGNHKIGLLHGWGPPQNILECAKKTFAKEPGIDIIIFGHSHNALNEKKAGILFFNPGSPTDKAFAPYTSYGIIKINGSIEAEIIKL